MEFYLQTSVFIACVLEHLRTPGMRQEFVIYDGHCHDELGFCWIFAIPECRLTCPTVLCQVNISVGHLA